LQWSWGIGTLGFDIEDFLGAIFSLEFLFLLGIILVFMGIDMSMGGWMDK
jgi:hypothetical protein